MNLGPLALNPPSQLNILRHTRNSIGMNRTQIRILKKPYQI